MIIEHFLSWMHTAPVPQRSQAVNALARAYLHSNLSYEERVTAESAMTVLLEDPSATVRFSLADALASSNNAPRHIIMTLAGDSPEIATIVLARSPIFSDEELVDMVARGNVEQQIAIACRGYISSALCGAIGEVGAVEACLGLIMNKSAHLSRNIVKRIAERHGANQEIRKILLDDSKLPVDIRLMLIEKLGAELGEFVSSKNWLAKPRATKSIRDTLDRSSITSAAGYDEAQVELLVATLIRSEHLTTAYLLRAICMGNITLFCHALSALSSVPAQRIEAMISQNQHSAFRAAYVKSGMPVEAFEVFSTALEVWRSLLSEPEWISRARMPYLVTRQLAGKFHKSDIRDSNNYGVVNDLMLLLQNISADMAREEARTHVYQLAQRRAGKNAAQTSAMQLNPVNGINGIDAKFSEDIEQSIAESLSREIDAEFENGLEAEFVQDIVEISQNDMQLPSQGANDDPLTTEQVLAKELAQTFEPMEIRQISDAA